MKHEELAFCGQIYSRFGGQCPGLRIAPKNDGVECQHEKTFAFASLPAFDLRFRRSSDADQSTTIKRQPITIKRISDGPQPRSGSD